MQRQERNDRLRCELVDLFQRSVQPASLYFEELPFEVRFADLLAIANKRREICIGLRQAHHASDLEANFGVSLVPRENTRYTLTPDDTLVVVAEDDL